MAPSNDQQRHGEEANSPILAGVPESEAEAGVKPSGAREAFVFVQGRRGGRALAAGAIALVLAGAALVAIGASDVAGKAAIASRAAESELAEVKKDGKTVILPDMGMGFPKGTFWPTLFCFSIMNAANRAEIDTLKLQLKYKIGIFGCDNVAVLSAEKIKLGYGHAFNNGTKIPVYSWKNPAKAATVGNLAAGDHTNSVKNTDIFINAWNILIKSNALWGHNWTVKVDPDAVFFAERLRWHVKNYTWGHQPYYFKNCDYKGPKLYGALEVFSDKALKLYEKNAQRCLNLPWAQEGWGEDEWIDTCMQQIGGVPQNDYALVGDHRCMSAECDDTWRAAFHDYKTPTLYHNCYKKSIASEKMKKEGDFCCLSSWDPADKCGKCQSGSKVFPGGGFCGKNRWGCHKCGSQTAWCRMKDGIAVHA